MDKMAKIKKKNKASKKTKTNLITKDMSFAEIMEKHPDAAMMLIEKGMHCMGCGMAAYETLEQGAIVHGLNPDKLVKELNNKFLFRKKKPRRRKTK